MIAYMKQYLFALAALSLIFACTPENNNNGGGSQNNPEELTITGDALDLGIVMTRTDGTTYKLYWAKSNLSDKGLCTNPEDYGDYYAWGETAPKENYSWSTYKFRTSSSGPFSKYNTSSYYGTVDNKTVLEPEDDVAHVKLGGKWRMPTDAEWTELLTKCTWTWTAKNGVNGYKVTGTNGNSIFLPAAGYRYDTDLDFVGSYGFYWSSSLYTDDPSNAWYVYFGSDEVFRYLGSRYLGLSVRPVSE